jgi:hypothetical protein
MSLETSSQLPSSLPSDTLQKLTGFSAMSKSWFCRYYDHLIPLIVLNIIWAFFCLGVTFSLMHFKIPLKNGQWNVGWTAGIGFWDATVSILTARAVFQILSEGSFSWKDFKAGLGEAWLKAFGLFLIWAGVIGWAAYNFYFYIHWQPLGDFGKWILSGFVLWFFVFWLSCFFYLWPILFFQNPPFFRVFYKSLLLVFENQFVLFLCLILFLAFFLVFCLIPVAWLLLGFVFFFSIQCMLLEKHFLKYKIIYRNKVYESFLIFLIQENKRDWKYFLRPWENK